MTSTLWRFVEEAYPDLPVVGVISQHPKHRGNAFDPVPLPLLRSVPDISATLSLLEVQLFRVIGSYCGYQRGGRWARQKSGCGTTAERLTSSISRAL